MRAGLPRILQLFAGRKLPASTSFNAGVIDAYPQAAAAMRDHLGEAKRCFIAATGLDQPAKE